MAGIYRGAERVIAWVGSGHDDTTTLARDFKNVQKDVNRLDLSSSLTFHEKARYLAMGKYRPNDQDHQRMLSMPSWSRHWIIQELLLARECLVAYGSVLVPLFMLGYIVYYREYMNIIDPTQRERHVLAAFSSRNANSKFLLARLSKIPTVCQDVRDYVYGLQSLFPQGLRIAVNYNKSVREVFVDTCVARARFFRGLTQSLKKGVITLARSMKVVPWRQSDVKYLKICDFTTAWHFDAEGGENEISIRKSLEDWIDAQWLHDSGLP